jgi:hypothetical protein
VIVFDDGVIKVSKRPESTKRSKQKKEYEAGSYTNPVLVREV